MSVDALSTTKPFSRGDENDLHFFSVDLLTNETTHIYLEAALTTKEQALSK